MFDKSQPLQIRGDEALEILLQEQGESGWRAGVAEVIVDLLALKAAPIEGGPDLTPGEKRVVDMNASEFRDPLEAHGDRGGAPRR